MRPTFFHVLYLFSRFRAITYHITLFTSSISFMSRLINIVFSQYCFKVPASVQNLRPGRLCCRVVQSSGGRAVSVLISGIILTEKNWFELKVWSDPVTPSLCTTPPEQQATFGQQLDWKQRRRNKIEAGIIIFSGSLLRLIIRAALRTDDDLVRTRGQSNVYF